MRNGAAGSAEERIQPLHNADIRQSKGAGLPGFGRRTAIVERSVRKEETLRIRAAIHTPNPRNRMASGVGFPYVSFSAEPIVNGAWVKQMQKQNGNNHQHHPLMP